MHEPRFKKGLGLGYAVSPTGADHCHNLHDQLLKGSGSEKLRPFGITEEVPVDSLGGDKVRAYKYWMEMRVLANCLSICHFPPWSFTDYIDLTQAVTGWDVTMFELVKVAQRTLNLARLFNLRRGFTAADDWLPPRMFQPQTSGALSETAVIPGELRNAIDLYYQMMGWDPAGVPRMGTLYELGIGWAKDYLPESVDKMVI
jgi:aldehyde:ferredoxin oxidoreductase